MDRNSFGLDHPPFLSRVDVDGLFQCPSFESACEQLLAGLRTGSPVQLLVAEPGMGKSTLLHRLAQGLADDALVVSVPCAVTPSHGELVGYLRRALGASSTMLGELEEAELSSEEEALAEELSALREMGTLVVFLLDDAERLDDAVIARLPDLLSMEAEEDLLPVPLAQIVLAVDPAFIQRLTDPDLDRLNAAIDRVCHLEPWDRPTTEDFLCAAVQAAGGSAEALFGDDGLEALFEESGGVPQRVNELAAAAMSLADTRGETRLTSATIREVAGVMPRAGGPNPPGRAFEAPGSFDAPAGPGGIPGWTMPEAGSTIEFVAPGRPSRRDQWSERLAALRGAAARGRERFSPWGRPRVRIPAAWRRSALAVGAALVLVPAVVVALVMVTSSRSGWNEAPLDTAGSAAGAAPAGGEGRGAGDPLEAQVGDIGRTVERLQAQVVMLETEMKGMRTSLGRIAAQTEAIRALAETAAAGAPAGPGAEPRAAAAAEEAAAPAPSVAKRPAPAPSAKKVPPVQKIAAKAPSPVKKFAAGAPAAPAAPATPLERRRLYEVAPGDTLWGIAQRFGMTVEALQAHNRLAAAAPIVPGQRLVVTLADGGRPEAGAALGARLGEPASAPRWYTVRKGDSLHAIGRRFAVGVAQLSRWNCLAPDAAIHPGQRLSLVPPEDGAGCRAG